MGVRKSRLPCCTRRPIVEFRLDAFRAAHEVLVGEGALTNPERRPGDKNFRYHPDDNSALIVVIAAQGWNLGQQP